MADRGIPPVDEWPAKAAELVDQFVDRVRDQIVRPIILVVRGFVFGLLMVTVAMVVIVALSVGAIRFLDVYLFAHHVWLSYALLAVLLLGGGWWIFRQHHANAREGIRD